MQPPYPRAHVPTCETLTLFDQRPVSDPAAPFPPQTQSHKAPDHGCSAWLAYAAALSALCRFEAAEALYVGLIQEFSDKPLAWEGYAKLAARQHHHETALTRWLVFRDRFPARLSAWLGMGNSYLALDRHDEAAALFRTVIERFPASPSPALQGLARVAAQQNDWPACAAFCRKALAATPEQAGIYHLLLKALDKLGLDNEKIEVADAMTNALPAQPRGWEILLDHAWRQGDKYRFDQLRQALASRVPDPNHRFALLHRALWLTGDFTRLAAEAETALAQDPGLTAPYAMVFELCQTDGRYRELLQWSRRRLAQTPEDDGALGAAFDALLQLGHYRTAYAMARQRMRQTPQPSFFLWSLIYKYYATLSETSRRIQDRSVDRHLERLGKALVLRWPHEQSALERLVKPASKSSALQTFITEHSSRWFPNAKAFLFAARSSWLLTQACEEVDDSQSDWLALRAAYGPLDVLPQATRGNLLNLCRLLFACEDRDGFQRLLDAIVDGDQPRDWRTGAATQVCAAAIHWFRDSAAAARAFRFACDGFTTRLHEPSDAYARLDAAMELVDVAAMLFEAAFFEARKPVLSVDADRPAACSSSFFLAKASTERFRPLSQPLLETCIDARLLQQLRVALRYSLWALNRQPRPTARLTQLMHGLRRLSAFAPASLEKDVYRHLRTLRQLALRAFTITAPKTALSCLQVIATSTTFLGFYAGRKTLSIVEMQELIQLIATLNPPGTNADSAVRPPLLSEACRDEQAFPHENWQSVALDAPTRAEEQCHVLMAALRCCLGDDAALMAVRDALSRRKARLEKGGRWVGLFDFRRSRDAIDHAMPDDEPIIPSANAGWQFIDDGYAADASSDYVVLVSCDTRYLLKYGWTFLATLDAESNTETAKRHIHLHVVNPSQSALDYLNEWRKYLPRLNLTLSVEARPDAGVTYYAMVRYLILETVYRRYRKSILISDIDFWWQSPGVAGLVTRLRGYDFGICENMPIGLYSAFPWCSVWSGLVYLADTPAGRAVLTDMCRCASRVMEAGKLNWFIDQNFFYDRLPTWKQLSATGFVNLRDLNVYGGHYLVPNGIEYVSKLQRSGAANFIALARATSKTTLV